MNNNGRKISSKYLLALIFTGLFFSVTLNSPANYSRFARFYKILASSSDTTRSVPDTTKPRLPARDTTQRPHLPALDTTQRPHLPVLDRSYNNMAGDTSR